MLVEYAIAVKNVGFLEYARLLFLDKDPLKTKLLISSKYVYPQIFNDEAGFVCVFPEPMVAGDGEETISLMGYQFPGNAQGKRQLVNLFRASIFHIGAHVSSSNFKDYEEWEKGKDSRLAKFARSIVEDVNANAYISMRHPDKLSDLAFANTLALKRLRRIKNVMNPATKIMAGLLLWTHTGLMALNSENEQKTLMHLADLLSKLKEKALLSFSDEKVNLKAEKLKVADEICHAIEDVGAVTETPFLPHTEELGACSIFLPSYLVDFDVTIEKDFKNCLEFLGGNLPTSEQKLGKVAETEAMQVFDSWKNQKEKDRKIISKYESMLSSTRFKSVEIPEQDYTEFLRIKARSKSEAHRLIESLLVARDAVDEDPRKTYGVLDLQDVIQVIASKSPRMDVFMLDENISKSYSWSILLDASKSMECIKDFALEILIILAEAANELLIDPTSWGLYAFNDRFLIIKDMKERYNERVKSRIGGIKFEGFTYMPDALLLAGQIMKSRSENLRLITVISDGWPYGYQDIEAKLSEILNVLAGGNIFMIGIGAKSSRMESLFRDHCTVYTLRDLIKKFSSQYLGISQIAAET